MTPAAAAHRSIKSSPAGWMSLRPVASVENQIAVTGRVRRPDRTAESVMGTDCKPFGFRLGQNRIGPDHGDGRVAHLQPLRRHRSVAEFDAQVLCRWRHRMRISEAAEFVFQFEGRRPEMRPVVYGYASQRIHRHQSADGRAVVQFERCGAEAALETGCQGSGSRTRRSDLEIPRHLGCGLIAEFAIGGIAAPLLVAAIGEVEQDRRRNDRNDVRADPKADAALMQGGLDAGRGVETEGRTARQHDGIDGLNRIVRFEQIGFARSRSAAQHLDGCRRAFFANHRGHAGFQFGVIGVADQKAVDIGNQVQGATLSHCVASLPVSSNI